MTPETTNDKQVHDEQTWKSWASSRNLFNVFAMFADAHNHNHNKHRYSISDYKQPTMIISKRYRSKLSFGQFVD